MMIREWRDKSTTTIFETQKGLSYDERSQRHVLFGSNMIDIKGKSIPTLLVEEVSYHR